MNDYSLRQLGSEDERLLNFPCDTKWSPPYEHQARIAPAKRKRAAATPVARKRKVASSCCKRAVQ